MRTLTKLVFLMAMMMIAIGGCKKDNPNEGNSSGKMQKVELSGKVTDINGLPIEGVTVKTGSLSATTDNKGKFNFDKANVVDKRAIIKFEKKGYFTITRSGVKENEMFIKVVMTEKGNSDISLQTKFSASSAKTLEIKGMKVDVSADGIMRADGSAYKGEVTVDMLYLDPNYENFDEMMPGGDLAGIREDGSESLLVSYGMTEAIFTDNKGNPLQLKSGEPAEVTFPIPEGMDNNPPETIPLWHFDEDKGIWIEDGYATLQGNVYVGTVTHFSWVNLDDPKKRVTLKGKVIDCNDDPVPFVKVSAEQTASYTNSKGEWSVIVPEYTPLTVSVKANGGSDSQFVPGQPGETTFEVRDLKVPCGSDEPGEPGTYTHLEKGSIKYLMSGTIWIITWDNNGNRFRWDFLDENENPENQITYIVNHFNRTLWYGIGGYWFDEYVTYDPDTNFDIPFAVDESGWQQYLQSNTMTIAGKTCKVYDFGLNNFKIAVWNGMMMLYEYDGEVIWVALAATLDVPASAFNKSFNITWI